MQGRPAVSTVSWIVAPPPKAETAPRRTSFRRILIKKASLCTFSHLIREIASALVHCNLVQKVIRNPNRPASSTRSSSLHIEVSKSLARELPQRVLRQGERCAPGAGKSGLRSRRRGGHLASPCRPWKRPAACLLRIRSVGSLPLLRVRPVQVHTFAPLGQHVKSRDAPENHAGVPAGMHLARDAL